VDLQTKDPDIGRPAQVNEAKLRGSDRVETSPVHLRGAFLVLALLSGDPEHRHYPRKEGYGNA
jgi:hypothetical protein